MNSDSINDQLLLAVTYHKVDDVRNCLAQGADPNYDSYEGQSPRQRKGQPYTPLRMVMFCISDCDLDDNGLRDFAEIAKLLLKSGADPKPAIDLAESRYGKYAPDDGKNLFTDVYKIVAEANNA